MSNKKVSSKKKNPLKIVLKLPKTMIAPPKKPNSNGYVRTTNIKNILSVFKDDHIFSKIGNVPIKSCSKLYVLGRQLGIGGFGVAYMATHIQSGQTVVIKKSNTKIQLNEFALKDVEEEVMFLKSFTSNQGCHPHISCYYDSFIDYDSITNDPRITCENCPDDSKCEKHTLGVYCIVMEYIKGKDLYDLRGEISEEVGLYMAEDLLSGLRDIHCKGILHNDIKMENIMFDVESSQIRFVDFGLACIRGGKCTGGTSGYIAPEVKDMFYPTIRDERADIYALGLTLAQVILDDTRINKTVIRNEIKSKKLQNLLVDMLKTDYKKRAFANTLLEKYFSVNSKI